MKNFVKINLLMTIIIIFIIGILTGQQFANISKETSALDNKNSEDLTLNLAISSEKIPSAKNNVSDDFQNFVKINVPAVMADNTGVMTNLEVYAEKGRGGIYYNFKNVLISPDTEHSIRNAINVASDIANISTKDINFYFKISDINASLLEGPSAGAAIAISVISILLNKTLSNDVVITGSLNHDGTIGIASGIKEKAIAAKKAGAKLFLVPYGLSTELNFSKNKYCKKYGLYEYCQDEYAPYWINISKEANITIKEIRTIQEAMNYFF